MTNISGYANAYMSRGWRCFMLSADKIPVRLCGSRACEEHRAAGPAAMEACGCLTCHGFYAATTDPERFAEILRRVPAGQLAIRTGDASGLVVVEVDPKNDGLATLAQLDARGVLPGTLMVQSGGGGIHLYYGHPGGYVTGGAHKLGRGVDVKADGGYVVAPPSLHRSGHRYEWTGDGRHDHPLCPLPVAVQTMLRPVVHPTAPVPQPTSNDRLLRARVDGVLQRVATAPDGRANNTLFWAAARFGELALAGDVAEEWATSALEAAAASIGYPAAAARRTIRSGLLSARRQPA